MFRVLFYVIAFSFALVVSQGDAKAMNSSVIAIEKDTIKSALVVEAAKKIRKKDRRKFKYKRFKRTR